MTDRLTDIAARLANRYRVHDSSQTETSFVFDQEVAVNDLRWLIDQVMQGVYDLHANTDAKTASAISAMLGAVRAMKGGEDVTTMREALECAQSAIAYSSSPPSPDFPWEWQIECAVKWDKARKLIASALRSGGDTTT